MSRPYSRYRDSGVEWLGDVPEHWEVGHLRRWLAIVNGGTPASGNDAYWDGETVWLTPDDLGRNSGSWIGDSRRRVTKDGIRNSSARVSPAGSVVLSTRAPIGHIAVTAVPAATNQGCRTLVPQRETDSCFVYYTLVASRPVLQALGKGSTFMELTPADLGSQSIPVPRPDEQRAIAAFLDRETERIDALVAKKRRLIERLQEYRSALITRTVTRGLPPEAARAAGLNPSPRLRPSGVKWLSDVPEHWEVLPLSHLATKFGSGITPRGGATTYRETGVPFLRSQNIHFDGLRIQDVARIAPSLHRELATSHVEPGDVLLNITGASIGRVCAVPDDFSEGNVNQHVCIIRPDQRRLLPDLLAAYLATPAMQREIQFAQSGASREGLTLRSIRNFKVVAPPLFEQIAVVRYLNAENSRVRDLTAAIESAVERLQEYRTALVTAAVTGKIDVRESAPEPVAATKDA